MNWMSSNFSFNRSGGRAQNSLHNCHVDFIDGPGGELISQIPVDLISFGYNKAAGCVFVEPVDYSRPFLAANPRQVPAVAEQSIH
jgi:hypothetical protein